MIQKIKCAFGRHTVICAQDIILSEKIIEHLHVCLHCPWTLKKEDRPIPEAMFDILSQLTELSPKKDLSNTHKFVPEKSKFLN